MTCWSCIGRPYGGSGEVLCANPTPPLRISYSVRARTLPIELVHVEKRHLSWGFLHKGSYPSDNRASAIGVLDNSGKRFSTSLRIWWVCFNQRWAALALVTIAPMG